MKDRKLRKWVVWTLIAIDTIALFVACSECKNTFLFIVSHLVAMAVFAVCSYILLVNSNKD